MCDDIEDDEIEYLPTTWEDIENRLRKSLSNISDEDFERFKQKVINHLDDVSKKEKSEPCDRGKFKYYPEWADTLYLKIQSFKSEKRVFPNIMLANSKTYEKIDAVKEKAEEECGITYTLYEDEGDIYSNYDFICNDCCLHFCIDNSLKINEFRLIYDEEPTFDGENATYTLLNAA